jgi:hypothetical protein
MLYGVSIQHVSSKEATTIIIVLNTLQIFGVSILIETMSLF